MPKTKEGLKVVKKSISVKIEEKLEPRDFFKDGPGLWIYSGFTERILPKAKSTKDKTDFFVSSFSLTKYMTDEQIESDLPKKHIFKESDVCAIVANLITKQKRGKRGILENTGHANLFYTKSFVVSVRWDGGEWRVSAWDRADYAWRVGGRVFSPATETKSL